MDGDPRPSWQSIKDQQAVQQKLLVLLCFHGNLWIGKSMTRDEDTSPVLPLSHPTCPRDTEPPTAWSSFPGEEGCSLKNKHLQQFIPKKHVFIFNWRRVGQHPRKGCTGSGNQRGTDRQTDSQDSTDPSSPSQTISPELSRHTELSGTSRADPALPGGQQPGSTPTGAVCSPRISQAPIPGVFQAGIAGGTRQIPARPHLPRHNHRVPEPERNLGGGRGRSCRERIQLQALPGLGRASKPPKSPAWHPKPSSPQLLRAPGAQGIFFQAGKKILVGSRQPKGSRVWI